MVFGWPSNYSIYVTLKPVIIIVLFGLFTKVVSKLLTIYFVKYGKKSKADHRNYRLLIRLVVVLIYLAGILYAVFSIDSLRSVAASLFAGAGVAAIILGFAAQKVLNNIIAGIFIAIGKPFRVGDRIKVGEDYGIVEDITLRQTVINTWDNRRVIIPNGIINEESIINYTIADETILKYLDIGISYDSDIDLARKIITEEVKKHPEFMRYEHETDLLSKDKDIIVRVTEFADHAIKLRVYFWAKDQPTAMVMGYDILESLKKRFDKEGIEIPFPYRTIVQKKDLRKPKKMRAKPKKQ
ncbi:mechanosensitive ion channel family protein [Candidatus Woesearchaeota archaeon]|nr:mechanosensitive ion channel family protein [Candidatus Woesearchaeota archaeon]